MDIHGREMSGYILCRETSRIAHVDAWKRCLEGRPLRPYVQQGKGTSLT